MEPIKLPDFRQKIDEAKIDHPDIWKVYENEETFIREDIFAKLGKCVDQFQKINLLDIEIEKSNSRFQNPFLAPLFKALVSGEATNLIPRAQNLLSMVLTQNYHHPLVQKCKPIADQFMKEVEEELRKDEINLAPMKNLFDKMIDLVPDESKSILKPLTSEIDMMYEADEDVTDVMYASNLFSAHFQLKRIQWLEDLKFSISNPPSECEKEETELNTKEFFPIEGNLSKKQISKALDFLCEVPVSGGKTLLSKVDVERLKTISLCLPKENSFKFDKISIAKIGGNKSKLYCFFGRLWDAHTPGLNKDLAHFAKFIQTYFNGFSSNLSTIQKGISGSKEKIKPSKFIGYIPLRTEI